MYRNWTNTIGVWYIHVNVKGEVRGNSLDLGIPYGSLHTTSKKCKSYTYGGIKWTYILYLLQIEYRQIKDKEIANHNFEKKGTYASKLMQLLVFSVEHFSRIRKIHVQLSVLADVQSPYATTCISWYPNKFRFFLFLLKTSNWKEFEDISFRFPQTFMRL